MFVEIKLARMKNVKLVELLHNENKIVNTELELIENTLKIL